MEQASVILQLLELLPQLRASLASLIFFLDEKRFDLRQFSIELVEK
jgi:hypothetical protein